MGWIRFSHPVSNSECLIHRALTLGVNQPEHKINKSLPPSTETNNKWTYFTFCTFMLQCLKRGVALPLPYSQIINYFFQVVIYKFI